MLRRSRMGPSRVALTYLVDVGLSVLDAEVPDERDLVPVWIGDGGELHVSVRGLDRTASQTPPREVGNVLVKIVHSEIQQGPTSSIGVAEHLDPPGLGDPQFNQAALHRIVVGRAIEQTFVPRVGSVEVRHGNNGEDMID